MGISIPKVETAHAILRLSEKYILQLRDDKPNIASPGKWCLFGGRIEPAETPLKAVKRELFEELSIRPGRFKFLWNVEYYEDFVKGMVRIWFYASNVGSVWRFHKLKEGKSVGIFTYPEIKDLDMADVIRGALNRFHSGEHKL